MDDLVNQNRLISVRECRKEIDSYAKNDFTKEWAKNHSGIFLPATPQEGQFVGEIFSVPHFQQLVSQTAALKGRPVADPFLIASAKLNNATVVTEELLKEHAAKVPNVCKHFNIAFMTLEEMMGNENLSF